MIWGDTDKIVDPIYAAEFGRIITGSEVTIIEIGRASTACRSLNPSWRRCRVSFRRKPPEGGFPAGRDDLKAFMFHLMPYMQRWTWKNGVVIRPPG